VRGLRFLSAFDLLSKVPECSLQLSQGRRVSYHVVGTGEPLLWFVGGPGLSASLSVPQARLLADRFAVHLIDPHGSGVSTPPADESVTPLRVMHASTRRFGGRWG
jgi:pimeloyl-ACP methyl ester carboxylesterase